MTDYVVYFSVLALLGIFYTQAYKKYVFAPKMQKLDRANQFRHARNLNAELIGLFWQNTGVLQNTGLAFDGATFEDTLDKLQTLRDDVYTTKTFKQLVGRHKTKAAYALILQQNITEQIQMQQQIKAQFNKLMYRYRVAA